MIPPFPPEMTCADGRSAGEHLEDTLHQMYVALFGIPREQVRARLTEVQVPEVPRVASHGSAVDYTIS